MNTNIIGFPAATTMTPEQALASAAQLEPQDVLVVGYDKGGDLVVLSSRMSRQDALWLCEMLKRHILEGLEV
jgi:L-ascorbate metabolism protein UlaG (beta-lactamase superfamily)